MNKLCSVGIPVLTAMPNAQVGGGPVISSRVRGQQIQRPVWQQNWENGGSSPGASIKEQILPTSGPRAYYFGWTGWTGSSGCSGNKDEPNRQHDAWPPTL